MADLITDPQSQSSYTLANLPDTEYSEPPQDSNDRIRQQQIIPNAVKNRFITPVGSITKVFATNSNSPVANGASTVLTNILTNASGGLVVQSVSHQVYIGAVSPENRMPEIVSSASYPFYTWNPYYDRAFNVTADIVAPVVNEPNKAIYAVQVRNNSGSAQIINFEVYTRYVANGSDSTGRS